MIPVDLWLGGQFLGKPSLELSDDQGVVAPSPDLPRVRLGVDLGLQGGDPNATVHVGLSGALWSGNYALGIPYDATAYELGADLVIRPWLFPQLDDESRQLRVRPFTDFAAGLRVSGLEQPWWGDYSRGGVAFRAGLGTAIGSAHAHGQVALRYEVVVAGSALQGVLDSAAQDMTWTWNPTGSRLLLELGAGFR
ncbi:MAG: hypothetical protein FJ090_05165 [Deltaproteobacteria bacterium]|nr:hypothetical protein [Deltaproteobacteria bacterium]